VLNDISDTVYKMCTLKCWQEEVKMVDKLRLMIKFLLCSLYHFV